MSFAHLAIKLVFAGADLDGNPKVGLVKRLENEAKRTGSFRPRQRFVVGEGGDKDDRDVE